MVQFFIVILALEFIILLALVIALIFGKVIHQNNEKKATLERTIISDLIMNWLSQKNRDLTTSLFSKNLSKEALLSVLEEYNHRFKDENWLEIKELLSNLHLLPKARKWARSFFWKKRLFSARCFALFPLKEDEKILIDLLEDPLFLVRDYSARAIVYLGKKSGITKIIDQMAKEHGYSYYFYKDLLVQMGGKSLYSHIKEIAATESKSLSIHLVCLDLLASKTTTLALPFLQNDLASENLKIRLAAVKVYARNPQIESPRVLLKCLQDRDAEIRKEAALGLAYFSSKEVIEHLEESLHDKIWEVRLQAAFSLKKMGFQGLAILKNQTPEINVTSFNAAQYALQFDW